MTHPIRRPAASWLALVFSACMLVSGSANAQAPWTVALTTTDPLPIGSCSAIALTATDTVTRDRARGPSGNYLTAADFDITVASPDDKSVARKYSGAQYVYACGCQGAKAGTVASVTAAYPAKSLPVAARAPGTVFKNTTSFKLGKRIGASNSPECVEAAERVAAAKAAAAKAAAAKKAAVKAAPAKAIAPKAPPATVTPVVLKNKNP